MSYKEQNAGFLTSSKLKVFMKNPAEYYLEYESGLNFGEKKSSSLFFGTLVDDYISLTKEEFDDKYEILEKGKRKSPGGEQDGKVQINNTELNQVYQIERELLRQPLMEYTEKYDKQKVIEWEYEGVKLRAKLDRYSKDKAMIRDWKTTSQPDKFKYDLGTGYNYITQQAFYWWLVKETEGIECTCLIDMIQSSSPYFTNVIEIPRNTILEEIENIKQNIITYQVCKEAVELDPDNWEKYFPYIGTREEMFKSKFYPYLKSGIQTEYDDII